MTLRYAIVGSGMMGQEHIRNIALLPDAKVTAIVEPDAAMRAGSVGLVSELFGALPRTYGSIGELHDVDAVVVALPNDLHLAALEDLSAMPVAILCEKPFGISSVQAQRMVEIADARSHPVWVAMEYRYMPPVERLIEHVHADRSGCLAMLSIREHRFPFLGKVGHWNRFTARTGGTLVEKCCHHFDLMRLLVRAEPVRVFASGAMDLNHRDERYEGATPDIIDNAFVVVDFANGVRASLDLCMFAEGARWQEIVTATCTDGQAAALVPGPARFDPDGRERAAEFRITHRTTKFEERFPTEIDPAVLRAGDHHGSTFFQHQRFAAIVRSGGTPEVGVRDGAIAVAMGEAAQDSIREGRAVDLPERLAPFTRKELIDG